VDLKAIKMLMNPKTKQEAESLDRISQYLHQYNNTLHTIQTSYTTSYTGLYET